MSNLRSSVSVHFLKCDVKAVDPAGRLWHPVGMPREMHREFGGAIRRLMRPGDRRKESIGVSRIVQRPGRKARDRKEMLTRQIYH